MEYDNNININNDIYSILNNTKNALLKLEVNKYYTKGLHDLIKFR